MISHASPLDLSPYGIHDVSDILHNPTYEQLFIEETCSDLSGYEQGIETHLGAVAVTTGIFTGRSPKDKYLVRDDITRDTVWWADQGKNDNKPISQQTWRELKNLVSSQLSGKRLFVIDAFCGANPDRKSVV